MAGTPPRPGTTLRAPALCAVLLSPPCAASPCLRGRKNRRVRGRSPWALGRYALPPSPPGLMSESSLAALGFPLRSLPGRLFPRQNPHTEIVDRRRPRYTATERQRLRRIFAPLPEVLQAQDLATLATLTTGLPS
jgi:hypothetical protein